MLSCGWPTKTDRWSSLLNFPTFFHTLSQDTKTAVVGDPLKMTWEILDQDSPYEIFVRDLVALDGTTNTELLLIDPPPL